MTREMIGKTAVLRADDGAYITNENVYSQTVYLGKNADEAVWRDATVEEYEKWQREHENSEPELTAEETTPAWDISQGEYIPVGFLLNRDGVTYECIAGHYAAWNKQPPNETYWKEAL